MFRKKLAGLLAASLAFAGVFSFSPASAMAAVSMGVSVKSDKDVITVGDTVTFTADTVDVDSGAILGYKWTCDQEGAFEFPENTNQKSITVKAAISSISMQKGWNMGVTVWIDDNSNGVQDTEEKLVGTNSVEIIIRAVAVDAGFDANTLNDLKDLDLNATYTANLSYSSKQLEGMNAVVTDSQNMVQGAPAKATLTVVSGNEFITLSNLGNGAYKIVSGVSGTAVVRVKYGDAAEHDYEITVGKGVSVTELSLNQKALSLYYNKDSVVQTTQAVKVTAKTTAVASYTTKDLVWKFDGVDENGSEKIYTVDKSCETEASRTLTISNGSNSAYVVVVSEDMTTATFSASKGTKNTDTPMTFKVYLGSRYVDGTVAITDVEKKQSQTVTKTPKKGEKFTDSYGNKYRVIDDESVELVSDGNIPSKYVIDKVTIKINGSTTTYRITDIGKQAFKNNKKLQNLTITSNVQVIKKGAFRNCRNLKTVTVYASTALEVNKNAFRDIADGAVIRVNAYPAKRITQVINEIKKTTKARVIEGG